MRKSPPYPWDPDRARVVEAQIMQRIREGDIYYPDNHKGMERFADKDAYNLGNPLRESKDTAIIFTALFVPVLPWRAGFPPHCETAGGAVHPCY